MKKKISLIVKDSEKNIRVDVFINKKEKTISRTRVKNLILDKKLSINKKATFKNMKVSAAFHGYLSLNKQKKIPKILKMMQFPCSDALSYAHFCEGRLDVVIQCMNKIWDIHPLIPIIKAAGGIASTWRNERAIKAGNVLISANKSIHKKMLRLLKPALK